MGSGGKGFKIGDMKSLEWVSGWEMKGVWGFLAVRTKFRSNEKT